MGGKAHVTQKKVTPHCPVAGCRVSQPHTGDPLIKALVLRYTGPDKLLGWVQTSMGQGQTGCLIHELYAVSDTVLIKGGCSVWNVEKITFKN